MSISYPSSLFKNSYSIFISGKEAPLFKSYISGNELINENIKILTSIHDQNLACMVIPNFRAFKDIEHKLFKFYKDNNFYGGFWGQLGMGYDGKYWVEL